MTLDQHLTETQPSITRKIADTAFGAIAFSAVFLMMEYTSHDYKVPLRDVLLMGVASATALRCASGYYCSPAKKRDETP